jgi:hypothetical protein
MTLRSVVIQGSWTPPPTVAGAPGEAARPGVPGVVLWVEGDRAGRELSVRTAGWTPRSLRANAEASLACALRRSGFMRRATRPGEAGNAAARVPPLPCAGTRVALLLLLCRRTSDPAQRPPLPPAQPSTIRRSAQGVSASAAAGGVAHSQARATSGQMTRAKMQHVRNSLPSGAPSFRCRPPSRHCVTPTTFPWRSRRARRGAPLHTQPTTPLRRARTAGHAACGSPPVPGLRAEAAPREGRSVLLAKQEAYGDRGHRQP